MTQADGDCFGSFFAKPSHSASDPILAVAPTGCFRSPHCYVATMLLNFLKGVAFLVFAASLTLALSFLFRLLPGVGKVSLLGIDLGFILGLWTALPFTQALFRRISWLRFRGL